MDIFELKKQRQALWERLNALIEEMKPFKQKEAAIRKEIKSIQDALFVIEGAESVARKKRKVAQLKEFGAPAADIKKVEEDIATFEQLIAEKQA